jgi:phospholipid/cholesterol/gamma-HCH transport system substrate-binding protein
MRGFVTRPLTTRRRVTRGRLRAAAGAAVAMAVLGGCSYQGLNSLPLPGTQGHGNGAYEVTVQFQNMEQVVPNSDVMVNDVNVGTVTNIRLQGWHAVATLRLNGNVVLPANVTASIGQQSLLGAMFIALSPPATEKATGRLGDGDTITLARTSEYPTTEQTLAAVAALLNGGGLSNISVITSQLNQALGGRTTQVRQLLIQTATLTTDLNDNKGNIVGALDGLSRLSGEAAQNDKLIAQTLNEMPSALGTLTDETPALVQAMSSVSDLSDAATGVINESTGPLTTNLKNLEPVLSATAAAKGNLVKSLGVLGTGPFPLSVWRGVVGAGGYVNLWVTLNLTDSAIERYYLALLQGVSPQTLTSGSQYQAGNPLSALLPGAAKSGSSSKSSSSSSPKPTPSPTGSSSGGGVLGGLLGSLGG